MTEIEEVADKLVTANGEREQAPQVLAEAIRDRQAMYTIFSHGYNEIRSVVGFIHRNDGQLETIAPSLFMGRVSSKKKATDTPEAKQQNPAATAPTATQPNAAAANTAQPAKAADVSEDGPFMHK